MSNSGERKYYPFLDTFRGLACLYVVVHHCFLQVKMDTVTNSYLIFTADIFGKGRWAVDFFIVISGFSLANSVRENFDLNSYKKFVIKRAYRIIPPFYVSLLLSVLLGLTVLSNPTGNNWDNCIPVNWKDIVVNILLMQDVVNDSIYSINHTFWSIAVEWKIYMLFPLITYLKVKLSVSKAAIVILLLSLCTYYVLAYLGLPFYVMSPQYTLLFFLGIVASTVEERKIDENINFILFGYLVFLLVMMYVIDKNHLPTFWDDVSIGVLFSCLLILMKKSKIRVVVGEKVGKISYSMYLIHAPILQIVTITTISLGILDVNEQLFITLIIGTTVSVVVSKIFFELIEKPFLYISKR